jgi:hypothetical protein
MDIDRDGGMKSELKHRANERTKVNGVLRNIWKENECQGIIREVCMRA